MRIKTFNNSAVLGIGALQTIEISKQGWTATLPDRLKLVDTANNRRIIIAESLVGGVHVVDKGINILRSLRETISIHGYSYDDKRGVWLIQISDTDLNTFVDIFHNYKYK